MMTPERLSQIEAMEAPFHNSVIAELIAALREHDLVVTAAKDFMTAMEATGSAQRSVSGRNLRKHLAALGGTRP